MARLIDADLAIAKVKDDGILGAGYSDDERISDVCDMIDSCPTVDAVEVVRCKDCKHCYKATFSSTGYRCKVWGVYDKDCEVTPEHYCSYGERKDNANSH